MSRIQVTADNAEATFRQWIAERGGVIHWENALIGDRQGDQFTPLRGPNGEDNQAAKPHWKYVLREVVTDISRFEFRPVKAWKEVKRFRVGVRPGRQGLTLKVTDGGSRRIEREVCNARKKYGMAYHDFDYSTKEAMILVPEEVNNV